MADPKKQEAAWKWFRLAVVDSDGAEFDPERPLDKPQIPFYSHTIGGHTFSYFTEKVSRGADRQTIRIPQPGAVDRLWVSGDADDEVALIRSRMAKYVVRWNKTRTTAEVFQTGEGGSRGYRPEKDRDEPISKYLRMEEVPEPAMTALV